jgi:hypothetical protein
MAASSSARRRAVAAPQWSGDPAVPLRVSELRVRVGDGLSTTVHVAAFPRAAVRVRVAVLPRPASLARWCREQGVGEAIVGGFFTRPRGRPLGQLRVDGRALATTAFAAPWNDVRAAVHIDGDIAIARRDALPPEPEGDLLQAGPLLVGDGHVAVTGEDSEGFSSASHQFDSDITSGRYPRAALALTARQILAVVCDGRSGEDAGMTLQELARFLVRRGARQALNLDGGGSASLVCGGRLVNRPREEHGIDLLEGRPISTALVFSAAAGVPRRRAG